MQQRNAAQFAVRFAQSIPEFVDYYRFYMAYIGPIRQPPGVRADHRRPLSKRLWSLCSRFFAAPTLRPRREPRTSRPAHGMVRPVEHSRLSADLGSGGPHGNVRPIERRSGPHCETGHRSLYGRTPSPVAGTCSQFCSPHPGWWRGGIRLQAAPRSHSAAAVRGWQPDDRSASVAS